MKTLGTPKNKSRKTNRLGSARLGSVRRNQHDRGWQHIGVSSSKKGSHFHFAILAFVGLMTLSVVVESLVVGFCYPSFRGGEGVSSSSAPRPLTVLWQIDRRQLLFAKLPAKQLPP